MPSAQRQAAVRAAWGTEQRDAGRTLWATPRVLTFNQYCERALGESWASAGLPDRLLSSAAEWAVLRELRRESGGTAEARALLTSIRTLHDWRISRSVRSASKPVPRDRSLLKAPVNVAVVDPLCERAACT